MAGMRYLTMRCPTHLHDMVMEKHGRYADLYRCSKCDVPIYYMIDESNLAMQEQGYAIDGPVSHPCAAKETPKVKPYIKRFDE